MSAPMVACRLCTFWVSDNARNGLCKHSAPRPTEAANQIARWPETFAEETCGESLERVGVATMTACEQCVFWRRPLEAGGIYPVDRLGARSEWWHESGHCMRYAPGPSSFGPGPRGFWRVTHRTDGCAEGVPAT